ncbi:MAG: radical SAM protein [Deltaproteobacteria bacterium]|nr:radical SAM protein [Deltaproteobacteria bacterium]
MKVVLINPPQVFSKSQVAAGVIPPLGLLYLAAALRQSGHVPLIIDSVVEAATNIYRISGSIACRGLEIDEIVARIPKDTGLVGVSNLFSFAFPVVKRLTEQIKRVRPDVGIAVGGAHPSALPLETVSEKSIDFVVISEGEETLTKLLNNLGDHEAYRGIDGLAYKGREGIPCVNQKAEFIEDLDGLPFPARDLVPLEKYYEIGEAHGPTQGRRWTPILSSRGCPYQCTFCTPRLWGRRYRVRSAENVLAEIEECQREYGIREFHFEDENLTIDKRRLMEICNGIIERGLEIRWQTPNGIRASVTDVEMLDLMKESGCCHVTVAPESGSERVLNEIIRKRQDLAKVTRLVRHAHRRGLKTAAYFIMGLPGETRKDVEMSIDYACRLAKAGLDEVVFSNFVALPGSELFDRLLKEGRFHGDWSRLVAMGDISTAESWSEGITSRELKALRRKAYLKFHLVKAFWYPLKAMRSVLNVLRKREELKTERVLITFIKRIGLRTG